MALRKRKKKTLRLKKRGSGGSSTKTGSIRFSKRKSRRFRRFPPGARGKFAGKRKRDSKGRFT